MMIDQKLIDKINYYAKLAKTRELTQSEAEERNELRKQYVNCIKAQVQGQIDSIRIQEPDGSIHKLNKIN